jgi:hypothetical protein
VNEKDCREIVRTRSDGCCEMCGVARAETMHHRLGRRFGPWSPSNIVHLCGDGVRGCHGQVTNTRTAYYDAGWLIRTWDKRTPAEIPFEHWNFGKVLLDDAGGYDFYRDEQEVAS